MADLISVIDILNLQYIPIFLVIFLILSFFIWKLFYKKDKTGLSLYINVPLIVLVFLFFSLSIIFSLYRTSYSKDFYFGIDNISPIFVSPILPNLLVITGIIGIFIFVIFWKFIPKSRDYNLKYVITKIIQFSLLIFIPFSVFFILSIFLSSYLLYINLLNFIFSPLIFLILGFIFTMILFKGNFKIEPIFSLSFKKLLLILLIFAVLLSLLFSSILIPIKSEVEGYLISEHNSYEIIHLTSKLSFSLLNTPIPIITFKYPSFSISDSIWSRSSEENHFSIFLSNNNYSINKTIVYNLRDTIQFDGKGEIVGISLNNNQSILSVRYNEKKLKEKKFNTISFITLHNINISEDKFFYKDNTPYNEVCYGNGCKIILNITNNLDKSVYISSNILFNFENKNITNKSACKFNGGNYIIDDKNGGVFDNCKDNDCIIDINEPHVERLIYSNLVISHEQASYLSHNEIMISKPLKAVIRIYLKC